MIIEATNIHKSFGTLEVLKGIDLRVDAREVISIVGASGAGKTTLTRAITALYPSAQVLCIDDLAWNEPFYQWDYLLVAALTELRQTGVLDLVPPAWQAHHVEGSINIASCPLVIVEGSGAGMRAVNGLIDAHVWVQTDDDVAEQRRIRRDIAEGVNNAVAAAREAGGELGAVRLDSGDLVAQAFTVRKQLDDLGATSTKITVTSDLDEYSIAALGAAPVDSYGVGTRLVTGSGHPTAEMVYKLVQREGADGKMHEVAKSSQNKASVGGLKVAGRVCDQRGSAAQELVVSAGSWQEGLDYLERAGARPLQVKLVDAGAIDESRIGKAAIAAAATRHEESRAELPYDGWRLSSGEPAVPTKMLDIFEGDD